MSRIIIISQIMCYLAASNQKNDQNNSALHGTYTIQGFTILSNQNKGDI